MITTRATQSDCRRRGVARQCKVFKSQTPISLHFLQRKQPLCIDKSMFYSYSADPTYYLLLTSSASPTHFSLHPLSPL